MGGSCFVPHCTSGYKSNPEKVSLFHPPKELLKQWQVKVPRADRVLILSDFVCEKHFEKDCIIRELKTEVYTIPLKRPKLAAGSIPTIFPGCPDHFTKIRKKLRYVKHDEIPQKKKKQIIINSETVDDLLDDNERSEGMMGDEKLAVLSPAQKRARRRPLSVEEKQVVVNIYKTFTENNPTNSVSKITAMTAQASGLAISSVYKVMKEYRSGEMVSPKAKSGRPSIIKNLDEGAKSYIRQKVHGFFLQNELPSVDKLKAALDSGEDNDIVPPLGRTSLYKVIKELGMNLQEPPTTIKQELPEIDDFKEEITIHEEDPLRIEPTAAESLARISPKGVIFIKEEPLVYVKQEPSFNGDDVEELAEVNQTGEEQSFPNLDQDPVDLMFLEFAKKFKTFSGKRQLSLKSRFCQIMAEAEIEEINERQNAAVVFT